MVKDNVLIILTIIGCGIVTWLPRVVPFIFSKKMVFSNRTKKFMSYIPMSILTALFAQTLFISKAGEMTGLHTENLLASIPTIIIGFLTKSLIWTVIVGIVSMGLIRYMM
ncbi:MULTISPECIES: AzlD domain-containing protein [Vagococcus]|uniref:Branched-chain amino acid transport protein azlD n=1 Tax=Vagococcus fluvialis bH819 TaxID=1255619 RepID=A0A1X6WRD1_9ENTE|nr:MULTISPECIES: AzlD domain-containing protein [Vagococcus]SLM86854.1 hypothetical protein FM121_12205 [Vagococcus fluvialis bH819]HCM88690.1 AzlD domain-containing protein [Vagococcus sp.]